MFRQAEVEIFSDVLHRGIGPEDNRIVCDPVRLSVNFRSHFGLIDPVTRVVRGGQARGLADGAVDVDRFSAGATDQMVVVVADAVLESRRGPGRLNPPDEASGNQNAKRIVHRLERDGADLGPRGRGHGGGREVRLARDDPKDSKPLGGHLDAAFTKERGGVRRHGQ